MRWLEVVLVTFYSLTACRPLDDDRRSDHSKTDKALEGVPLARVQTSLNFQEPSWGLYWMGAAGQMEKTEPGLSYSFYNPQNPTLIYVHGWQPDMVKAGTYDTSLKTVAGENLDIVKPWFDKGWNVGFFFWTQFADDFLLTAEQKIWDAAAMTWKDAAGYQHKALEEKSASELFWQQYRAALEDFQGPEIRIVGHSLGSQMASALVELSILEAEKDEALARLVPLRLALLDPFLSGGDKDYLEKISNSTRITRLLQKGITQDLAFEIYRSSSVSFIPGADSHAELIKLSAFRNIYTDGLFRLEEQDKKHTYVVPYYFLSIENPPREFSSSGRAPDSPQRCVVASSSAMDVQSYMKSAFQARSSDSGTVTPLDDSCILETKGTY